MKGRVSRGWWRKYLKELLAGISSPSDSNIKDLSNGSAKLFHKVFDLERHCSYHQD